MQECAEQVNEWQQTFRDLDLFAIHFHEICGDAFLESAFRKLIPMP